MKTTIKWLKLQGMPKVVLFLCTGNYYRSRFAEILFNHRVAQRGIEWQADSRGLARKFGDWNVGPISPLALGALIERKIPYPDVMRDAMHCAENDLTRADLIVALKEAEHRPLLAEHFAGWEDRVEYWHVHDLDAAEAPVALAEIERRVADLIERIAR